MDNSPTLQCGSVTLTHEKCFPEKSYLPGLNGRCSCARQPKITCKKSVINTEVRECLSHGVRLFCYRQPVSEYILDKTVLCKQTTFERASVINVGGGLAVQPRSAAMFFYCPTAIPLLQLCANKSGIARPAANEKTIAALNLTLCMSVFLGMKIYVLQDPSRRQV